MKRTQTSFPKVAAQKGKFEKGWLAEDSQVRMQATQNALWQGADRI